jgi:hypothetical protein
MSWWRKLFGVSDTRARGLEVHLLKGTDILGRETTRVDVASDKYTCDTCDRRLAADEGFLLATKQVVVSVESWRRVLLKWKRQFCAQPKENANASRVASKRGCLFVTRTKEKTESLAESFRRVLADLRREYADLFVDLAIHLALDRASSETPWVICEGCAPMFTFDREHARGALEKYRRTGEFPREQAVVTLELPKTGGRILIQSNDDEGCDAMLKAIDAAMAKDLGGSESLVKEYVSRSYNFVVGDLAGTAANASECVDTPGNPPAERSVRDTAETWLQYYIDGFRDRVDQQKESAVRELYDLSLKDPARAWEVVQHINAVNIPDSKECQLIDVCVGGSLLANILYACQDALWETILTTAAGSTRLRRQLAGIDESSLAPQRWQALRRFLSQGT